MNTGMACVLLVIAIESAPPIKAAPNTIEYELSEKCGKEAHAWFAREWGTGTVAIENTVSVADYRNHYNSHLNACFVDFNVKSFPKGGGAPIIEKQLFEINENKTYAEYTRMSYDTTPSVCFVGEKKCNSDKEWEKLIKPYMKN